MNIRNKLILLFVTIVAFILMTSSVAIYFFSADNRQEEFYKRLENKAKITARLLLEVDEITTDVLKKIEKDNPMNLPDEELKIYDYRNDILFSSDKEDFIRIDTLMLDRVRLENEVRFTHGQYECLGFLFTDTYGHFVVIVGAVDIFGLQKLANLRTILLIVFGVAIVIILLAGYLYVGKALHPIAKVISEVDEISATNLHRRVDVGNGKDELSKLASTFNNMLSRIDHAFAAQKTFIANASHEIRNPLTAILGQIEVSLLNPRSQQEYREVLESLREDITNLKTVSNRLLLLAQASMENVEKNFAPLRLDQLLWDSRTELLRMHPSYTISINLDPSIDDDSNLRVFGDEQLLKGAIINILDNGCKYSADQHVKVRLKAGGGKTMLEFVDNGIGIAKEEIPNLFEPFYRGTNAGSFRGNGIGLSLAHRIIKSHLGEIIVDSELSKGTRITVHLPILNPILSRI